MTNNEHQPTPTGETGAVTTSESTTTFADEINSLLGEKTGSALHRQDNLLRTVEVSKPEGSRNGAS